MEGGDFLKRVKRTPIYKSIWLKIRYYQLLNDITDAQLAECLQVGERTLREYDKSARHVTLEKVDNFLVSSNLQLGELLAM